MELLDCTEKLMEAQSQSEKLQTCLDNIMKERVHSVICLLFSIWLSVVAFLTLFVCFLFVSCMYKFGDLDPGSAELFLQEERIKQLRTGYEAQCRVTLLTF